MKPRIFLLALLFVASDIYSQKKPLTEKVVTASEKINKKSKQINDASKSSAEQIEQAGENVKAVANNVKTIIKVFEPIFRIHLKKIFKGKNTSATKSENQTEKINDENLSANKASNNQEYYSDPGETISYDKPAEYQPVSDEYNSDGTANWGNQYNVEFGNYLDAFTGTILDGGSAEDKPDAIDLIYLAPNDGQNAYYLITPNFAHDSYAADAFWGSATTDNPVKSWKTVNESELAITTLTGQQFEKIQYNEQLRGAVKQARGYSSFYSSTSKLDGKVFAVKSEMNNRTAYALIYIVRHVGTSGSQGYLKVKIKCTGFDNNGDGQPDISEYNR